jgi:predicted transcriptional regulator
MTAFTVQLDQATSEALAKAAAERSTKAEDLIAGATEHFLAEQSVDPQWSAEDIAAVDEGLAQLDRGEGVPHEQVKAEMREKYGA